MQQEDYLRGLGKVMEFMQAISILLVIIHTSEQNRNCNQRSVAKRETI